MYTTMSARLNLDEEVRLYSTNAEREKYGLLATLFGIIVALEYLERAYYKTMLKLVNDDVPSIEQFMSRYRVGVPATIEHSSEAGPETAKWVAETTQNFITFVDALKLRMRAKDQLHPILQELVTSYARFKGSKDWEGRSKMVGWWVAETIVLFVLVPDELGYAQADHPERDEGFRRAHRRTSETVHNPFRDRYAVSPPTPPPEFPRTAASQTAASDASHPQPTNDVEPSQRSEQSEASGPSLTTESTMPSERSMNDLLTEELPPAYTPAPNVYEGEATLELGPRRPFQQPAQVPPQNHSIHRPPWVSPQETGSSSWSAFPGGLHRESPSIFTRPAPPPVHPSLQNGGPPQLPSRPLSDFARDFYTAGADMSTGVLGGPSSQYQGETHGAPSSSSTRYAPPPGEPPNRSGKGAPPSPVSPADDPTSDDARPTETPVPGHPLLRHGKILVYPRDYECPKCRNTGYKNYDPSHPCSRCWDKSAGPRTLVLGCANGVKLVAHIPAKTAPEVPGTSSFPAPARRIAVRASLAFAGLESFPFSFYVSTATQAPPRASSPSLVGAYP
ncbi:LOW QUALITY PROTEIN: hypothetical protein ACG7TL_005607 [Trametes sanguinea]